MELTCCYRRCSRYTSGEYDYMRRGRNLHTEKFPRQHSLGAPRAQDSAPISSSRSPRASDPEFCVELRRRLEEEQERIRLEEEGGLRFYDVDQESDADSELQELSEPTGEAVAEGLPSPISLRMIDESPSPTTRPKTTQVSVEVHHEPKPASEEEKCDGGYSQFCAGSDTAEGAFDDRTSQRSDPTASRPQLPPRELRIRSVDMRVHSHSMEIVSPEKHRYHRKTRRIKSYDDVADYDVLRITEFTKGPFYNVDYDAMSDGSVGSLSISKVRYYDTGSMEQLDEDNLQYFGEYDGATGGAVEESDDTETLNGTRKYKELWELRATLEDECSDPVGVHEGSSLEMTPDKDNLASGTTSFESNTDPAPYLEDCELGNCTRRGSKANGESQNGCSNLLHPNYENRRQSYKNILTKRLQKQDAPPASTSAENSFDSMETMDTDGEVSDTSRHEVTTTSFESTTDNTTDSNNENQNNRLKQMRGDSGYKSLETQSTLKGSERKRGSVSLDYADTIDQDLFPFDLAKLKEVSPPVPSPFDFDRVKYRRRSSQTCHFERRGAKTASKKRREYSRERQAVQVYESIMEPETDSTVDQPSGDSFEEANAPSKVSVFSRFFRSQSKSHRAPRYVQRDYSVDQKTSELFNEFMRIDPIYETRRSPRLQPRPKLQRKNTEPAYLESRRPDRLAPDMRSTSLGSDSSASSLRRLSPQDSIEEEEYDYEDVANVVWPGSSRPSPLTSQPTIHEIPIIKLPEEDTADC